MKHIKKLVISVFVVLALNVICVGVFPTTYITVKAAKIQLNKQKITLAKGNTAKLKITGTTKNVKWSSNKKSVATVSTKGKVTAKKKGTATITARVGKKKYKCKVTVLNSYIPVKQLYLCPKDYNGKEVLRTNFSTSLWEGISKNIPVKILPQNTTYKKITWKSSNNDIVSVSNGTITAHKIGTAVITAECDGKKASCNVRVVMNTDEAKQHIEFVTQDSGSSIYIVAKNNYKYPVSIEVTTEYFKNGSTISSSSENCNCLMPGETCILQTDFYNSTPYETYKSNFYVCSVDDEVSTNISGISCIATPKSDGIEVEFTNSSPNTGNSQKVKAVFYKNGTITSVTYDQTIYVKNVGSKDTVVFNYPSIYDADTSTQVPVTPDSFKICINDVVVYTGTP